MDQNQVNTTQVTSPESSVTMLSSQRPAFPMKLIIFGMILILLVGIGAFFIGRNTAGVSVSKMDLSVPIAQSRYEKCMYQCMEGRTKGCRADMKDYIDNYDMYYSTYGVSRAFAEKYSDPNNPQSREAGYKVLCFQQVVYCRKSLCEDYLNNK